MLTLPFFPYTKRNISDPSPDTFWTNSAALWPGRTCTLIWFVAYIPASWEVPLPARGDAGKDELLGCPWMSVVMLLPKRLALISAGDACEVQQQTKDLSSTHRFGLQLFCSCWLNHEFQDWNSPNMFQRQSCIFKLLVELMGQFECFLCNFSCFQGFPCSLCIYFC